MFFEASPAPGSVSRPGVRGRVRAARWGRRALRVLLETAGGLVTGALFVAGFLAWRFQEGPIRLDGVQTYLVAGLNQAVAPFSVSLDSAVLSWGGVPHAGLGFSVQDVRLLGPDGEVVARVPLMEVGFSIPALLTGRVVPTRLRVHQPHLQLVYTERGAVQLSVASASADDPTASGGERKARAAVLNGWLETLAQPPGARGRLGALRQLEVTAAQVDVVDYRYGVRWMIPRADALLTRDSSGMRGGVRVEAALGDQTSVVSGAFLLRHRTGDLLFSCAVDRVTPARMAVWSPAFAELGKLDTPLSGQVRGRWAFPLGVTRLEFDLSAGAGQIRLQEAEPALALTSARIQGSLDRVQRTIEIRTLSADFGGPKITGSATLTREGAEAVVDAEGMAEQMPASQLARYWLPGWAPGARHWVTANISSGWVPRASSRVRLALPLTGVMTPRPVALRGAMTLDDLTVHYLRPLPPATNAFGSARFTLDGFHITVDRARVGDLRLEKGQVDLLGLDDHSDRADIRLTVKGSLADQLQLLDRPPLGYPRRLGLDSTKAGGDAITQARFQFPLFKDLPLADVAVAASSTVTAAALPRLVMGQDLTDAALSLRLDGAGMTIDGKGRLGPAPATFSWQESFLETVSPGTRITFSGMMDETARQAFHLAWPEVIGGMVKVDGTYTADRGKPATLDAQADLSAARLTLPWFGFEKGPGKKAAGKVRVIVEKKEVTSLPAFEITGAGAEVSGKVDFADNSAWQKVVLDTLRLPGTALRGSVARAVGDGLGRQSDGLTIDLAGSSADVRALFPTVQGKEGEAGAKTQAKTSPPPDSPPPLQPLELRFDIGRVVTGENLSLSSARGHLVRSQKGWTLLDLDGRMGEAPGVPLSVKLVPKAGGGRSLTLETDDAGLMCATLGLSRNIRGGRLRITGQGAGAGPVDATVDMGPFNYLQTKTLARMAREAKPEGADALARKDGIPFARLKASARYTDDTLEIRDARVTGDIMGLTTSGTVDMRRNSLDLSGTFVPLYGLNGLVGGIPVIGWLLTGGEGGGVFAATYRLKGPQDDPALTVNPLSLLAPGVLRELFFVDRH